MAAPPPASEVLAFAAAEAAAFFGRLAESVANYTQAGAPPASLLAALPAADGAEPASAAKKKGKRTPKRDPDRPKRAPTAYNAYITARMAELKAEGYDAKKEGNPNLMAKCAESWKAMPEADKAAFTAKFAAEVAAHGAADAVHHPPALLPPAGTPLAAFDGEKKKKKKKRHSEDGAEHKHKSHKKHKKHHDVPGAS